MQVTTNGDSFLIAFGSVTDAIAFCLRTQTALMKVAWPEALLRQPDAAEQK